MIVTVTPNPAWDITLRTSRLTPGASHRVPPGSARAGGKGINVARVLTGQRLDALAVLTAGGSTGSLIAADLTAAGQAFTASEISGQSRRTVAIVDDSTALTSIFNESGPELDAAEVDELLARTENAAADADVIVGSGSLPPGCPVDFYAGLVRIAHDHAASCIIDASGPAMLHAAEAGADLLKPNVEEVRDATGHDDPFAAAADLLDLGAARILLSDGARGMYDLAPAAPTLHAALTRTVSGNATGAGDAAVAAAAAALAAGSGRDDLLRQATAWSAAAVTMPAAGELPDGVSEWAGAVRLTNREDPTTHEEPS